MMLRLVLHRVLGIIWFVFYLLSILSALYLIEDLVAKGEEGVLRRAIGSLCALQVGCTVYCIL
jgi:succinate dehydrogenase/fumarate reductase cytochrome b subunit